MQRVRSAHLQGSDTHRPREDRPREKFARDDVPGGAPPRKPGFHGKKKFVGKRFGQKSNKPGGGYKGKNPRPKP